MIVSRRKVNYTNAPLLVYSVELGRVIRYKDLGSCLVEDWDDETEIRSRIEINRQYFFEFKSILTKKYISLKLRMRYCRC